MDIQTMPEPEIVAGYKVVDRVLYDNGKGMAFALNEDVARHPMFVNWQYTEENGKRDYYWGHYDSNPAGVYADYLQRGEDYKGSRDIQEVGRWQSDDFADIREGYKLGSTQGQDTRPDKPAKDAMSR